MDTDVFYVFYVLHYFLWFVLIRKTLNTWGCISIWSLFVLCSISHFGSKKRHKFGFPDFRSIRIHIDKNSHKAMTSKCDVWLSKIVDIYKGKERRTKNNIAHFFENEGDCLTIFPLSWTNQWKWRNVVPFSLLRKSLCLYSVFYRLCTYNFIRLELLQ